MTFFFLFSFFIKKRSFVQRRSIAIKHERKSIPIDVDLAETRGSKTFRISASNREERQRNRHRAGVVGKFFYKTR